LFDSISGKKIPLVSQYGNWQLAGSFANSDYFSLVVLIFGIGIAAQNPATM
jgi:hypothetical protein